MRERCLSSVDCPARDEVDILGAASESGGVETDLWVALGVGLSRGLRF